MNIELKKLKIFLPGSKETINFVSDIYVNGKKAGYAENQGTGGMTFYDYYNENPEQRKLLKEAEDHCLTLPPEVYSWGTSKMNLEKFIDNLVYQEVNKKERARFEKKLQKDQLTNLLFAETPEGKEVNEYCTTSFNKGKVTIAEMLTNEQGKKAIADAVARWKVKGYRLINTNIPSEILNNPK